MGFEGILSVSKQAAVIIGMLQHGKLAYRTLTVFFLGQSFYLVVSLSEPVLKPVQIGASKPDGLR
jgi:hypothetical protein